VGALNTQKHVQRGREQIIAKMLPDFCNLYPLEGENTIIDGAGIITQIPSPPRQWRGSINIPCRADVSRSFKNDGMKFQTAVVDEYNLELPYDVEVEEEDIVMINGVRFEIRKLKNLSNWELTREAIIIAISINYDNPNA